MISNIEALDRVRETALQVLAGTDCRILVCSGTGCIATGSEKVYEKYKAYYKHLIEFVPPEVDVK